MLVIRLSRVGRRNRPLYRLVVQERDWAPSSKAIEIVGHYNPHTNPATVKLQEDRIKYWLSQGAQASATVHNMLVNARIIDAPKKRVVRGKKKKQKEGAQEAEAKEADNKKEETSPEKQPEAKAKKDSAAN